MSGPREIIRAGEVIVAGVRFANERSRNPVPVEASVCDLVGGHHHVRAAKAGTTAVSFARYLPGKSRGKRNVVENTALVFDFDHLSGETAEAVWRRLKGRGWAFVAYSSFSHLADGADDVCFRLVLFLTRPVRPKEFEHLWQTVNAALGGYGDNQARDISRIWYVAACPAERVESAWFRVVDGLRIDIDEVLLDSQPPPRRGRRRSPAPRPTPDAGGPIPEGGRNARLVSLAGGLRRTGAGQAAIREFLLATNRDRCAPPLEDSEIEVIAGSVCRYDPTSPLLAANRTDLGNAERFVDFVGDRFRFCHIWGCWLAYDGRCWRRDSDGAVVRAARDTLRAIAAHAQSIRDEDHRSEVVKHALDSESSARVSAMHTLAQSLLGVSPKLLDADPELFNVANGTIDLRTGELRPHDRDQYLTKISPVEYDPAALCPRWEAFLLQVLGGSVTLVRFVQRAIGYSLTGLTTEQVLFLLYGTGANGKSTLLETLRLMLGDYATIADFTTFLKRDTDGARNDLARLVGTRFVSAVEAEAGRRLDEALVKQLTGGDTITARFLFKEFFDYKPNFKIWLAANHKPTIGNTDHGIWRRIRLVPFTVTIPDHQQDKHLPEVLAAELTGILAWAVRGCLDWRRDGLGMTDEVRDAIESYKDEMDVFGPFIDECCFAASGAQVKTRELNGAYSEWCEQNGERKRSAKALGGALRERGFVSGRLSKGVRCWKGLRLRRESDILDEGDGCHVSGVSSGISPQVLPQPLLQGRGDSPGRGDYPEQASQPDTRHPEGSATRHPDVTRHPEVEEGEL